MKAVVKPERNKIDMRIYDEKLEVRSCKMHACVRHSLQIFRWSGVFPVTGLNDDFMTDLRYHVTLLHGIFIMMILLGQTLMSIAVLYKFVSVPVTLEGLGSVVFFLTATVNSFKLLKLARNWPKLMKSAFNTERAISDLKTSKNIPILCKTALFSVATLGIVEHFLRKTYDIKAAMFSLGSNASHLEIYFEFQKASLPYVLYMTHNQWLAMFFEIILIHSTVLWNIIDALIMCACIYMASCLQDLNATIYSVKSNDATNWRLLREQYSKLIELLNKINKQLGGFVFLSLFENLFEVCLQLFNSINHGKDVKFDFDDVGMQSGGLRLLHFMYFNFSTVYTMGKTFTLLLLAARVSYFAKEPLLALSYVPDSKYGIEIQRFSRQIRYTSNAISGVHFGIKKEAVVKVLASIITYELMMLQLGNE